nr:MAG TPA: hypothetical protein [Caudoviricetes sp.]
MKCPRGEQWGPHEANEVVRLRGEKEGQWSGWRFCE